MYDLQKISDEFCCSLTALYQSIRRRKRKQYLCTV